MNDESNGGFNGPPDATPVEPGAPDLEERLAVVEGELAEAKDRLLRALAETENTRRRAQRDATDAARYGAASFAKDLLNVADNLRRALDSTPESDAADELTRNLRTGVAATERELLAAFERNGMKRIAPAVGDRFDPNLHQAMFEIASAEQAPGSIVQILQPGYLLHDRLLRPALVGVAKAGSGG